jgi:hypothetical protein
MKTEFSQDLILIRAVVADTEAVAAQREFPHLRAHLSFGYHLFVHIEFRFAEGLVELANSLPDEIRAELQLPGEPQEEREIAGEILDHRKGDRQRLKMAGNTVAVDNRAIFSNPLRPIAEP